MNFKHTDDIFKELKENIKNLEKTINYKKLNRNSSTGKYIRT